MKTHTSQAALQEVPPAPDRFDPVDRELWDLTAGYLVGRQLLHIADLRILEDYCDTSSQLYAMRVELESSSYVLHGRDKTGTFVHPLVAKVNQVSSSLRNIGQSLGLTARGRAGLQSEARQPAPAMDRGASKIARLAR